MGQIGNILDGRFARPLRLPPQTASPDGESNLARLIPGMQHVVPRQDFSQVLRQLLTPTDINTAVVTLSTTLLIGLALQLSGSPISLSLLLFAGVANFCSIVIGRELLCALINSEERRNVVVVGSGTPCQRIVDAIERDMACRRKVKRTLTYTEFEEICNAGQFSTFARHRFIDEIVIATPEANIARVIREARRQRLDVTVGGEALGGARESVLKNQESRC